MRKMSKDKLIKNIIIGGFRLEEGHERHIDRKLIWKKGQGRQKADLANGLYEEETTYIHVTNKKRIYEATIKPMEVLNTTETLK